MTVGVWLWVGGAVGVWLCVGGAVGVWLWVGGAVGVWLWVGGAVGVWLCVGGAVAVLTGDDVAAGVDVVLTFTVVVLLWLHPAVAAATAVAAIAQIIFVLSISPPRVAQQVAVMHYFNLIAPMRRRTWSSRHRASFISCPVTLGRITRTG